LAPGALLPLRVDRRTYDNDLHQIVVRDLGATRRGLVTPMEPLSSFEEQLA